MILQDHHLILALIACAAVLGLAVGYCIEVLRSSSREARLNDAWDQERAQLNAAIEKHKASAETVMAAERKRSADARTLSEQALARHDTLQMHTEVQAKKIANLEAELRAAEEQNVKMQSDFASFKLNKDREIDVLRAPQQDKIKKENLTRDSELSDARNSSTTERLPVLSKRVVGNDVRSGDAPISQRLASSLQAGDDKSRVSRKRAVATAGTLSALMSDAEIPMLAESELPDSTDELDFASLLDSDEGALTGG